MVDVACDEYMRKKDRRLPRNYVLLENALIGERYSEALNLLSNDSSRKDIQKVLQDDEHKFSEVLSLATEKQPGYPHKQERVIKHLTQIAVKCELSLPSRNVKDDSDDDTDEDPDDDPLAHAISVQSLEVASRSDDKKLYEGLERTE
ncbi:hypothetical protein DDE83_001142 [Stemphylium lycopersici]|uniref:Uncharacterized protein n=1 Tax=Stemphylium lycopersici TaxID=183478 RepID=A0A364NEH7_STELY|nr:hypothetical protein DDE83_001142 [Stemphylium lycopersici]